MRASLGVVHALGDEWRTPAGGRVDRYLQTDIGLQPGFSGSLLVDLGGRAIGMNNAGLVRGTSLALPPATLRRVVETLVAHGHVRRGFLGIGTIPVRLPAALEKSVGQRAGLLVTSVAEESGAGRAGLLLGDVIVGVEGKGVASPGDLLPFLEEDRIGQSLSVRIVRAGDPRDVAVTVGAREPKARTRVSLLAELSRELAALAAAGAAGVVGLEHRQGQGSGVVLSPDGYILTNAHVARAGGALRVRRPGGAVSEAELIGADERTDLAVVRARGTPARRRSSSRTAAACRSGSS